MAKIVFISDVNHVQLLFRWNTTEDVDTEMHCAFTLIFVSFNVYLKIKTSST